MRKEFFKNISIDVDKNKGVSVKYNNFILTNNMLSFGKTVGFVIKGELERIRQYSILEYMNKSAFSDRLLINAFSDVMPQIFRIGSGIGEISKKFLNLIDVIVNKYFKDIYLKEFLLVVSKPYKEVGIDLKLDINLSLFFNVISALAVFKYNLRVFDRSYVSLYLAKQNNDFYDIKFNISISIDNDENIVLCISNIDANKVDCRVIYDETLSSVFKSIYKDKVFLSYTENKIDMYGYRLNK